MKLTLDRLYRDHDDLRRILYLLEQQLLEICRGHSKDYPLVQRLLGYIQDHPERVHHPAEEAVFSVIFRKDAGDDAFRAHVRTLMKDHSEIEGIILDAVATAGDVLVAAAPDINALAEQLYGLINRQRSHLLFEELHVYPYIVAHMSGDDWAEAAVLVPAYEAPVFGDQIRAEHAHIFRE